MSQKDSRSRAGSRDGSKKRSGKPRAARLTAPKTAGVPTDDALGDLITTVDQEVGGRAADVAAGTGEAGQSGDRAEARRLLVFLLGEARFAVFLDSVTEMGRLPRVTRVPRVPAWVRGVANLRGDVIAVLDLALFLTVERPAGIDATRMLVVRSRHSEVTAALLVDRVVGLLTPAADAIGPPAAGADQQVARFLEGVTEHDERLVAVLNLEKLLASSEMQEFQPL